MTSPRRKLNSRQIEVFRAVMVTGSLTGASRELQVAQPSLSRMMRRIEDLVGFALFTRVKGRLLPTIEARRLFTSIEHIQAQIESLDNIIEQIGTGGAGVFRVGASPSLARRLIPDLLAGLRTRFADLRLQLDVVPLAGIVDYLALGVGECFVSMTPIHHPVIVCAAVGPGRLVALLPPSHRLTACRTLTAADLVGESLIMCETGSPHEQLVQYLFAEVHARPTSSVIARFAELAIGLTAAGLGVAVVDEFTALNAGSAEIEVRPIEGEARFHVHLSRSSVQPKSRFAAAFETELRRRLAHAMRA